MKRILIACFIMILLCTTAYAAEWPEGLSPQKPYTGTPEVDFQKTIGYMIMSPVKGSTVIPGTDMLSIYLPRMDVETGSGEIVVYNRTQGSKETIAVSAETMAARPMEESELQAMMWGSGTVFFVMLEKGLEPNCEYYVEMSEGCIVSPDYEAVSPEIKGKTKWYFNTNTKNIIEKMRYFREVDGKQTNIKAEEVREGDKVKFSIKMDEDAAIAAVYFDTGRIALDVSYYTENSEAVVTFPESGVVKWGVVFIDANGGVVGNAAFTTNVAPAAE